MVRIETRDGERKIELLTIEKRQLLQALDVLYGLEPIDPTPFYNLLLVVGEYCPDDCPDQYRNTLRALRAKEIRLVVTSSGLALLCHQVSIKAAATAMASPPLRFDGEDDAGEGESCEYEEGQKGDDNDNDYHADMASEDMMAEKEEEDPQEIDADKNPSTK